MAGWRDSEGRTVKQRTQQRGAAERSRFMETLRYRPLSVLKALLGLGFVLLLIIALVGALR